MTNPMRALVICQNLAIFGSGLIFPFYIIFINKIGASFTEFGIAFAVYSLAAALSHELIGKVSDRVGRGIFLLLYSWGTAILLLFFPIVTDMYQVYILQALLGIFGAMVKTGEKALLADMTESSQRGARIGRYHAITSIAASAAVIAAGYLIDLLTLEVIFYIGSFILFISGLWALPLLRYRSHVA